MLGNLDISALVVSGDKTLAFFDLIAARMAECLPAAQRATIAGIGHGGPTQNPEVFNALLIEFLAQN
jgi:pimeloyl-ACP methyl ester carboxylesterase